jgi:hypothetical protein
MVGDAAAIKPGMPNNGNAMPVTMSRNNVPPGMMAIPLRAAKNRK